MSHVHAGCTQSWRLPLTAAHSLLNECPATCALLRRSRGPGAGPSVPAERGSPAEIRGRLRCSTHCKPTDPMHLGHVCARGEGWRSLQAHSQGQPPAWVAGSPLLCRPATAAGPAGPGRLALLAHGLSPVHPPVVCGQLWLALHPQRVLRRPGCCLDRHVLLQLRLDVQHKRQREHCWPGGGGFGAPTGQQGGCWGSRGATPAPS